MYDSLRIISEDKRDMRKLENYIDDFEIRKDGAYATGLLKNMKILKTEDEIKISGSLPKYYCNTNLKTLSRDECKLALQQMGAQLHIPIEIAKIVVVHIGTNFEMEHPVDLYLEQFDNAKKMGKSTFPKGLLFSNRIRAIEFYDKILEMKTRSKIRIPPELLNRYILRYELKYTKRLKQQLRKPDLVVADLWDKEFYQRIIQNWKKEYFQIKRNVKMKNINPKDFDSIKDFRNQLLLKAIQDIGGREKINLLIEIHRKELKRCGNYNSSSKTKIARLKREVEAIMSAANFSPAIDNLKELDEKIIKASEINGEL